MSTTHPMQRTFDELRRARRDDPTTSKDAARGASGLAADHQQRILAVLRARRDRAELVPVTGGGALTPHQIAALCDLDPVQVSRRIRELADDGAIVECGTGETPNGRRARAWRLA